MGTSTLRMNLEDMDTAFIRDLKAQAGASAEVEIHVKSSKHGEGLFTEAEFWAIIDLLDWGQASRDAIIAPAVAALAAMPMASIYLFHDMLSEKLYRLDTRQHGDAYLSQQDDGYLSVDDFLYVRCAAVAEGQSFYDLVSSHPENLPADIDFEHLLSVAPNAYQLKTGREFDYAPLFNYETYSNAAAWKSVTHGS